MTGRRTPARGKTYPGSRTRHADIARLLAAVAILAAAWLAGCATAPAPGDRLFESGDLTGARDAYLAQLEEQGSGRSAERALFRLGLIYLHPESPLFDPEEGETVLERLSAAEPTSAYARQASLLLGVQAEVNTLRAAVAEQAELRQELESALSEARDSATLQEVRFQAREKNLSNLSTALARLKKEIERLTEEVAAREDELERLKAIDLDGPP